MSSPSPISVPKSAIRGLMATFSLEKFAKGVDDLTTLEVCKLGILSQEGGADFAALEQWCAMYVKITDSNKHIAASTIRSTLSRAVKAHDLQKSGKFYTWSPDPVASMKLDHVNILSLTSSSGRRRSSNGTTTTTSSSRSHIASVIHSAQSFFVGNRIAVNEFKALLAVVSDRSSTFRDAMVALSHLTQNLKKNGYARSTASEIDTVVKSCTELVGSYVIRDLFSEPPPPGKAPSLVVRTSLRDGFSWEHLALLDYDGQIESSQNLVPFLLHLLDLDRDASICWDTPMICVKRGQLNTDDAEIITNLRAWFRNVRKMSGSRGRIMVTTWVPIPKNDYIKARKQEHGKLFSDTARWNANETSLRSALHTASVEFLRKLRVLGLRTARDSDLDDFVANCSFPDGAEYTIRDMMSFGSVDDGFIVRTSPGCTTSNSHTALKGDKDNLFAIRMFSSACDVWNDLVFEPGHSITFHKPHSTAVITGIRVEARTMFRCDGTKVRLVAISRTCTTTQHVGGE